MIPEEYLQGNVSRSRPSLELIAQTASDRKSFVQLLLARQIDLDPTLDVFEDMYMQGPGATRPAFQPVADRLPPQVRRRLLSSGLAAPPEMQAIYRGAFRNMLPMIGILYRAGIPIEDVPAKCPGSRSTASWNSTWKATPMLLQASSRVAH
jgi:hypothetical protein